MNRLLRRRGESIQRDLADDHPEWPAGVRTLVAGIEASMSVDDKLFCLVRNFANIDFTYTMRDRADHQPLLDNGTLDGGDCGTLSRAMVEVATTYLGIEDVATHSVGDLYVPTNTLTVGGDSRSPTVDGGQAWAFSSHTWVVGPGDRGYDPLFGDVLDQTGWEERRSSEPLEGVVGVNIDTYDGGTRLIGPRLTAGGAYEWLTYSEENEQRLREEAEQIAARMRPPRRARAARRGFRCYLTTACVEARGLSDDCHELQVLRRFRDGYLRSQPGGPELIARYYEEAPWVVAAIRSRQEAPDIWDEVYGSIRHSVALIETGAFEAALATYISTATLLRDRYGRNRKPWDSRSDDAVHSSA